MEERRDTLRHTVTIREEPWCTSVCLSLIWDLNAMLNPVKCCKINKAIPVPAGNKKVRKTEPKWRGPTAQPALWTAADCSRRDCRTAGDCSAPTGKKDPAWPECCASVPGVVAQQPKIFNLPGDFFTILKIYVSSLLVFFQPSPAWPSLVWRDKSYHFKVKHDSGAFLHKYERENQF